MEGRPTYKCPDCQTILPLGEDKFYYCDTCKESLATDLYSVKHFASTDRPFKLLVDAFYIPSIDVLHPAVKQKLVETSILKELTIRFGPEDDISRIEWFRDLLKAQKNIFKLVVTWECSTDPDFVKTFSSGLGSSTSLTELILVSVKIHSGCGSLLGEAIASLKNLISLQIYHLTADVPEDLAQLSSALKTSKSIEKCVISGGHNSWNILDGVLAENKSIKSLGMTSEKTLDENSLKRIFKGLVGNNTLLNLEIECPFDRSALEILTNSLRSNRSVTELALTCNIDNNGLDIIGTLLNSNKTIKSLKLPRNNFVKIPATILSSSLTALNLDDGKLDVVDVKEFSEALKRNKILRKLNLRTKLSSSGCRSIMEALQVNNTLDTLSISLANSNEEDLLFCRRVLETHPSLVDLTLAELDENDRNYSVFGIMVELIKKNTNLETLNALGPFDDNYNEILGALRSNETLTAVRACPIDSGCNLMSDEEPLIPIFELNYALTDLSIYEECPVQKYLQRNREHQRKIKADIAIVLHNIARDIVVKSKLPDEMWIHVFKWLRYPGLKSFAEMARNIFNKYKSL